MSGSHFNSASTSRLISLSVFIILSRASSPHAPTHSTDRATAGNPRLDGDEPERLDGRQILDRSGSSADMGPLVRLEPIALRLDEERLMKQGESLHRARVVWSHRRK